MKRYFTLASLTLLLLLSCSSPASAQRRAYRARPYHHHHYSDNGFLRSLQIAEDITETALLARHVHHLDDYTGIRIGYNAATFRLSGFDYADLESSPQSGLDLGLVFGWNLGHSPVVIEPGIYYSMKGGKMRGYNYFDGQYEDYRSTIKATMHMLEIPLVFKYNIHFDYTGITLQPFVGGFFSIGLGGKSKDTANHDSYETFGDDTDQFDAIDAGLRTGVGMAIDNFYMEAACDLGLVNLPNNNYYNWGYDNGFSDAIRSNCVSFNIGFNF